MGLDGHRILVVDDKAEFARTLKKAIEQVGGEAVVAKNPQTALTDAKSVGFSAALMRVDYSALVRALGIPVVVYGPEPPPCLVTYVATPAQPEQLVAALERLLVVRR